MKFRPDSGSLILILGFQNGITLINKSMLAEGQSHKPEEA